MIRVYVPPDLTHAALTVNRTVFEPGATGAHVMEPPLNWARVSHKLHRRKQNGASNARDEDGNLDKARFRIASTKCHPQATITKKADEMKRRNAY